MPVNVPRLRTWFAAALAAVILLVAGFYFYARVHARLRLTELPKRLGVDIQQSTQGFTMSKSEGGHTLYTIHASHTTQFKQGGLEQLQDVNVLIYGREGNRLDRIYGKDFEYDPGTGNITSKSLVHLDLQANPAGSNHPDQDQPPTVGEPVHVLTTGLVFNSQTGMAVTKQRVEFQTSQANGFADGAAYDSHRDQLLLNANVHMTTVGTRTTLVTAESGVITKQPRRAILQRARMQRENTTTDAGQLTLFLRDDNSVEHAVAVDGVRSVIQGASLITVTAPQGVLYLAGRSNEFQRADLTGGAAFQSVSAPAGATPAPAEGGASHASGTADTVHVDFGERSMARKIEARGHVHLVQMPAAGQPAHAPAPGVGAAQQTELFSDAMDFWVKSGKFLDRAETLGPGRMLIVSAPPAVIPPPKQISPGTRVSWHPATTEVLAQRFTAHFDSTGRIDAMHGDISHLRYESFDQPVRQSRSRDLDASFTADGQIASLVQKGRFYFEEFPCMEPKCDAPAQRKAWAETAVYVPATGVLNLAGSPRVVDGGMTTTARKITMNRATGEAVAEQDVKSTYSELKPQPGGALLAGSDPIHVTARTMTAERATGVAHYQGDARLWQAGNMVEADTIDFDRNQRTMVARGAPPLQPPPSPPWLETSNPPRKLVTTVLARQDQKGNQEPVNVTSEELTYADQQCLAHFEGNVIMRGAEGVTTADRADVYLRQRETNPEHAQRGVTNLQGSQVDHVVASGDVHLQQPTRQGWGDKLVYLADQERFVLTGKAPHILDAEHGAIWGDSLTFFQADDRVIVEGTPTHRTLTDTRVSK